MRLSLIAIAGVLAWPAAKAQAKDSGAVKYGIAVGSPAAGLPIPGAGVVLGRATWRPAKRFAFRTEMTLSHLPDLQGETVVYMPCPAGVICQSSPKRPNSLAGISEQVILNDDFITRGESKGGYYVLGGGLYRAFNASAVGSLGGAIEGGLGFKFGAASLEAKVVYIRHWIGGDNGIIPVTFGYTW